MTWAKVAVLIGSLLAVVAFCVGVDTPISTTVAGDSYDCADVIPPGMLVSGQPTNEGVGPDIRTTAERRLDARRRARCEPLERRAQRAVWGGVGIGGLVLLAGWAALREHELDEERPARRTAPVGV